MENEKIITREEKLKKDNKRKRLSTNLILLMIKLLILIFVYLVFFRLVFGIMRMDSPNMNPAISEGELLIVFRLEPKYDIGDTVVINKDNKTYISRIVAVEKNRVNISDEKTLLVDETPEEHLAYYSTEKNEKANIKYPYTVEPGRYFVLNDYRTNKDDSRTFGTINKSDIKGKVIGKIKVRNI